MAMLAEPKRKQKWSNDPRNTNWTNDTNRFGYQMLTKMGWESGKGLGAKEDGSTEHIKSAKRRDNLGLGADKSNEDNWLSHQLAFDDLLSKLNQHSESGTEEDGPKKSKKKHELEKTAWQSRKRVFYNRFIQSKDLSSKSAKDMACIFGQRSKSAPGTPQEQSEGEESDTSTVSCPPPALHGVKIVNSGQSIQEYFEKKMREMKAAREGKKVESEKTDREQVPGDEVEENGSENHGKVQEESTFRRKKKVKKRKRKIEMEVDEMGCDETGSCFGKDDFSVKKKKKKVLEKEGDSDGEIGRKVQETRREEKKSMKRKEKNFKETEPSDICKGDGVQCETKEYLIRKEVKAGKKNEKRKKKDKNISSLEMGGSRKSNEGKEKKNKVEQTGKSVEEETYKPSVEEKEKEKDKRKKGKRKEENAVCHDCDIAAEITMKEGGRKKKKKKDKSKSCEKN